MESVLEGNDQVPRVIGDQAKPGKGPMGFRKKGLVAVKRVGVVDTQGPGGIRRGRLWGGNAGKLSAWRQLGEGAPSEGDWLLCAWLVKWFAVCEVAGGGLKCIVSSVFPTFRAAQAPPSPCLATRVPEDAVGHQHGPWPVGSLGRAVHSDQ